MFDQFIQKRQMKQLQQEELAAEKRQINYGDHQQVMASSTDPNDDNVYLGVQDRKSDLIRWQQELDNEMLEYTLGLLSLKKTQEGKVISIMNEKDEPVPPLCNMLFINQVIVPNLKQFTSKNLINTFYEEKIILKIQENTMNDMADLMSDNYDKYGIDFVNFDGVLRGVKNIVSASIWRAHKGWTKKVDSSMIKRIEHEQFGEMDEHQKGIKRFFRN